MLDMLHVVYCTFSQFYFIDVTYDVVVLANSQFIWTTVFLFCLLVCGSCHLWCFQCYYYSDYYRYSYQIFLFNGYLLPNGGGTFNVDYCRMCLLLSLSTFHIFTFFKKKKIVSHFLQIFEFIEYSTIMDIINSLLKYSIKWIHLNWMRTFDI